jgi:hypothetical protein
VGKFKSLSKTVRRLDEAAPLGRRADQDPFAKQGDLGFLDEYEKVQGGSDRVLSVDEVDEAIRLEEAANEESRRVRHITDPESGFEGTYWQTNDPSEYAARWNDQLNSDRFGAQVTMEVSGSDASHVREQAVSIAAGRARNTQFQMSVKQKLELNPRWTKRVEDWLEDSPYGSHVFVHMDRQVNPLQKGMDDQLQFGRPREMGVHSGTPEAAARATIVNEDLSSKILNRINGDMDFAADALEIPREELHQIAGGAIERYFENHFRFIESGQNTMTHSEMWDELEELLKEAFFNVDMPEELALKLIGDMRSMPTTVATPHLFRGKNGLLLQDNGNFYPGEVAKQLQQIFKDDWDEIEAAAGGSKVEGSKKLAKFLESKGYDHIVYINAVEDRGLPSIINWNPELWVSIYDPSLHRGNSGSTAKAMAAVFMGQLGIGSAFIRDGE